jgi:hypothetical protein
MTKDPRQLLCPNCVIWSRSVPYPQRFLCTRHGLHPYSMSTPYLWFTLWFFFLVSLYPRRILDLRRVLCSISWYPRHVLWLHCGLGQLYVLYPGLNTCSRHDPSLHHGLSFYPVSTPSFFKTKFFKKLNFSQILLLLFH